MAFIDWTIVASYMLISIGIGLYFTRRASNNLDEYFIAGRSLVWWVAGTSIVATTFSADTPLFVAGLSRSVGVYENWFWWSQAFGGLISVYFFSRLWRRTKVRTDIEFIKLRYEGKSAVFLRYFMALYKGVFFNLFILSSVTLAVAKLATVILGLSSEPLCSLPILGDVTPAMAIVTALAALTFFYTILSGLYGVVYTDLIQFFLAMFGSISLAVIAWNDAGSSSAEIMGRIVNSPDYIPGMLNFLPSFETLDLKVLSFVVYMGVLWWGMAPGYAYQIQRMLACKTERDALLANLFFNVLHYAVRSWPWIIVGLLSMIYFPNIKDPEMSYPLMIDKFLPAGLKGIMVVSLIAAYMSTINTLLNWGSSYIVNDFVRPIWKNYQERTYVNISRLSGLLLAVLMILTVSRLNSIIGIYKYVTLMESGAVIILVLRWYWWRVNAWTEISALITSLIVANFLELWPTTAPPLEGYDSMYPIRVLITTLVSAIVWIIVMYSTSKKPTQHVINFYKRVRIGGSGWKKVRDLVPDIKPLQQSFKTDIIAYLVSVVFVFSCLYLIGKILFGSITEIAIGILVCVSSGIYLIYSIKKIDKTV